MIVLVLGGTRSGKSAVAEQLAAAGAGPVTYIATAAVPHGDTDFAARVAAHRRRRPPEWAVLEHPADLTAVVAGTAKRGGTLLIDSLGAWVLAEDLDPDVAGLVDALVRRQGTTIVVSEEVGLGVHPPSEIGVRFADALGKVNIAVATVADRVLLVVAGRCLELPPG